MNQIGRRPQREFPTAWEANRKLADNAKQTERHTLAIGSSFAFRRSIRALVLAERLLLAGRELSVER
jgi:hypothetical protein